MNSQELNTLDVGRLAILKMLKIKQQCIDIILQTITKEQNEKTTR